MTIYSSEYTFCHAMVQLGDNTTTGTVGDGFEFQIRRWML